jgi:hypothetical protein
MTRYEIQEVLVVTDGGTPCQTTGEGVMKPEECIVVPSMVSRGFEGISTGRKDYTRPQVRRLPSTCKKRGEYHHIFKTRGSLLSESTTIRM